MVSRQRRNYHQRTRNGRWRNHHDNGQRHLWIAGLVRDKLLVQGSILREQRIYFYADGARAECLDVGAGEAWMWTYPFTWWYH